MPGSVSTPQAPHRRSDHTTALISLQANPYQTPHPGFRIRQTDLGSVAEALVYYESLILNVESAQELADLFALFGRDSQAKTLAALFRDRTLRLAHFSFENGPFRRVGSSGSPEGPLILLNAESTDQAQPGWLDSALLSKLPLETWLTRPWHRVAALRAMREGALEIKAGDFGSAIVAARRDLQEPRRAALLAQAFVDDVFQQVGQPPPEVTAIVEGLPTADVSVHWNVDLREIGAKIGRPDVEGHTIAVAAAAANRVLWLAARERCDLFAGSPLSQLLGDKLQEVVSRADRPHRIIQNLEAEVAFPDVRSLVNAGQLPVGEVLRLRSKATRFRQWLQQESERDTNTLIAYLTETAKQSGFSHVSRRTLRFFAGAGAFTAGAAATSAVQHYTGDPGLAASAAALTSAFTKQLLEALSRRDEEWKPVVFGRWATDRISRYLQNTAPRAD